MKYWDINKILPYQRNFNFINGPRSIGKTYTTQKYILKKCMEEGKQFVYIVRTKAELEGAAMERAFEKVTENEFPEVEFKYTTEEMCFVDENGAVVLIGFCLALSQYAKIKIRSFPRVYFWLMDEYMLESNSTARYVNGWNEPDVTLSIYHTIDREEDRVKCFFLGNNTSFYNPYHLHPAFHIPEVRPGEIWTSENVLFQWAVPSDELTEEKKNCKFLRMIDSTNYERYSVAGEYIEDNNTFIKDRPRNTRFLFILEFQSDCYGVWLENKTGIAYIDSKIDPSCKFRYTISLTDHNENTIMGKSSPLLKWLVKQFKNGAVRFTTPTIKKKGEILISMLL